MCIEEKLMCKMTEEGKNCKTVSQISKRSKLTLSLKNDSLRKFSSNGKIGQSLTGKLQDEVMPLSSGSICECINSCTIMCDHKKNKLCETEANDVISIESDSVKQDEDTADSEFDPYSKIKSSCSLVEDIKVIEDSNLEDVPKCSDDKIENSCSENLQDLHCSIQATCHTVANGFTRKDSRLEGNIGSHNDIYHNDISMNLENEECSKRKVATWLSKQTIANDARSEDFNCTVHDAECAGKTELSEDRTKEEVTSEFFSGPDEQQDVTDKVQQCPLCWKELDKNVTSHLKLCAAKHKITTQQLLEALELQKRQMKERHNMGLPIIRRAATTKKSSAAKKGSSMGDSNLQLALALSASLQEAEELEQDNLLESGLAEPESFSPGMVQRQLKLLENYGFTSSRPALQSCRQKTSISKAKLKSYPLLNRTKEERERLITEKVAIILMGEEEKARESACSNGKWQDVTDVTSDLLLKFQHKGNKFWEMARDKSADVNKDLYYVQSLAGYISPCKVQPGNKLKHLSQIQGRINTPKRSSNSKKKKITGSLVVSSEVQSSKQQNIERTEKFKQVKKLLDFSPGMQCSSAVTSSLNQPHRMSHSRSLCDDWASVMNKQAMSDITIYTGGGKKIPAHKLVFYARCPVILCDVIKEEINGKLNELLMWVDVSYEAALAFLEFLYCGTMNRILSLGDDVAHLEKLAQQYQVTEVIEHLRVMQRVRAHIIHDDGNTSDVAKSAEKNVHRNWPIENSLQKRKMSGSYSIYCETEKSKISACFNQLDHNNDSSCGDKCVSVCTSPDMFDVDDGSATEDNASQKSRASVDCLLNLMNKENMLGSDQTNTMDIIYSESKSSIDDSVMQKHKLCTDSLSRCYENEFLSEGLISGDQKYLESNEIGHVEKLSENMCPDVNNVSSRKHLLAQEIHKQISPINILKINTSQIPTLDLTQDEKLNEYKTSSNKVSIDGSVRDETCVNSRFSNDKNIGTLSEGMDDSYCKISSNCSQNKQTDKNVLKARTETLHIADHDIYSKEGDVTFVDNIWDDFDDLGVVPNLSFYSSPHNRDIFGATHNSGGKSSSTNSPSSTVSCSSQTSAEKNGRNNTKRLSKAVSVTAEVVSPLVHCEEVSSTEGALPSAVPGMAKNKDDGFKDLLEDSFVDNLNSSALWRGECKETQKADQDNGSGTTEEPQKAASNKVTPLPDYSAMKTPLLKKELFRYGLKPLNRKHAKQILRHIYNELHPFVSNGPGACSIPELPTGSQSSKSLFKEPGPDTVVPKSPVKRFSKSPSPNKSTNMKSANEQSDSDALSQASCSSSVSSDSSMAEETILEMEMLSQANSNTSEKESVDFQNAIRQYIRSTPKLYEKILQYEPIWLEELQADLKAQKLKFNIKQLMDYLDEQCITFRTVKGQRSRAKRKRKVSSSLSQSSRGRPRKRCTQSS